MKMSNLDFLKLIIPFIVCKKDIVKSYLGMFVLVYVMTDVSYICILSLFSHNHWICMDAGRPYQWILLILRAKRFKVVRDSISDHHKKHNSLISLSSLALHFDSSISMSFKVCFLLQRFLGVSSITN